MERRRHYRAGYYRTGKKGDQLRLSAAAPVQGPDGPGPADTVLRQRRAVQGPLLPVSDPGGSVRQRLSEP